MLTLTYFMTISNYVTGFSMKKLKQKAIFCKLLQPMIGSWGQVIQNSKCGIRNSEFGIRNYEFIWKGKNEPFGTSYQSVIIKFRNVTISA